ncbi:hypothetical protein [Gimesia sp.]|uniref:hypothetical protein n=1 Tax=Gimesia sp. TaxID=2024833 RepID=UPI000C3555F0|nr:hypothetical protein [Gimesia sp.]MAX36040.1 hypothetical protein [Gimesia sp.]HAH46948.1 hypothetical protein [Planctomycetaceae bacterium]
MKWIDWVSIVAMGAVGYILDIDLSRLNTNSLFYKPVDWIQDKAPQVLIISVLLLAMSRLFRWSLREKTPEQRIIDRHISDLLDKFRQVCFPELPQNTAVDHNRVTLFKHVDFKFWVWPFKKLLNPWGYWLGPWSGWLCVIYRSGHITQDGATVFLAPDAAQNSEGIAGQAWRSGAYRVGSEENKLPDLNGDKYVGLISRLWLKTIKLLKVSSAKADEYDKLDRKVKDYARNTNTSVKSVWQRLKKGKTCPTSILGVIIRNEKKECWGVLVMDSSNGYSCIDTSEKKFRAELSTLNRELRRYGIFEG